MRLSCNGCRVLRKGCSEECSIRPCLQWIKSPDAQANATLFLAKFYGRAGLINLISSGPHHLRPSIFRSLLEEACGRIVNPIYGSTGLISTGNWHLCEAAVEAVLTGSQITQIPIESAVETVSPVFKSCDIRHVSKTDKQTPKNPTKVKNQTLFKRSKPKPKPKPKLVKSDELLAETSTGESVDRDESVVSQCRGSDSGSVDTVEDTLAKPNDIGLSLTLGFRAFQKMEAVNEEINGPSDNAMDGFELRLGLPLPEVC
ncbi:hypothetical protein vseg_017310 [Gypsophila vaccaria]